MKPVTAAYLHRNAIRNLLELGDLAEDKPAGMGGMPGGMGGMGMDM